MICKIKETVEKYGMFNENKKVTVGVSGGADSCALLVALCQLREEYSLEITAAHVNHGIRGEEALRDELFVKRLCDTLGVEVKTARFNVPEKAKEMKLGVEECGRILRYEFLQSVDPSALVATAHNLNDCCETLILNLTRGASAKGLASIPPVRGNIIRPLINCTRAEIEAFCKENQIDFVTDSTNCDDVYTRNNIRLNVLPKLKEINPSFEQAVSRLMEDIRLDNDYFGCLTQEIIKNSRCDGGYNCKVIADNHRAVIKRVVARIIEIETGILPENKHIAAVCSILSGGKTQISGATQVTSQNGILSFGAKQLTEPWCCYFAQGNVKIPNGEAELKIIHNSSSAKIQFVHKNVLDFNTVEGNLVLRSRREGDEIKIAGRNCTKKLKKMFIEEKIADKNSVCVLADDNGVVWVEGFGCAHRCRITDKTENILTINITRGV
ncbi:MAG: tRNA lysidine(34) synthetase TilS [Clostridia bacterium]|nr:tRNA lysidine(34) synthetase TilS [Clostridia bacterium]